MVFKMKCSRKYLSLSDFWVSSSERLSDFYAGSWQQGDSAWPLLVVRLALAALAVAVLSWSLYEAPNKYWLIFLTNWGLTFVSATMLSGVLVSFIAVVSKPDCVDGELPWYMSMYWFLYNVGISLAFMITALYWILLYDPDASTEEQDESGPRMFWLDVATHAVNSCIALVELLVSRTPVSFFHLYQPLGVGLWYAAFSAIYYVAGGTDINGFPFIYEILDWRHGKRSLVVVAASALGLIIIYTLVWGLALCRDKVSAAIFRPTAGKIQNDPPVYLSDFV